MRRIAVLAVAGLLAAGCAAEAATTEAASAESTAYETLVNTLEAEWALGVAPRLSDIEAALAQITADLAYVMEFLGRHVTDTTTGVASSLYDNITDYIYAMTEQIIEHITQTASIIYR